MPNISRKNTQHYRVFVVSTLSNRFRCSQSMRVTTEIGYSNVITPDDKNIRLFLFTHELEDKNKTFKNSPMEVQPSWSAVVLLIPQDPRS